MAVSVVVGRGCGCDRGRGCDRGLWPVARGSGAAYSNISPPSTCAMDRSADRALLGESDADELAAISLDCLTLS